MGHECNDWHRDELCTWHPGNLLPLQVPGTSPTVWILRSGRASASPALATRKRAIIPRKKPDGGEEGKEDNKKPNENSMNESYCKVAVQGMQGDAH